MHTVDVPEILPPFGRLDDTNTPLVILSASEGSEKRQWMHTRKCTQILHLVQDDKY